MAPSRQQASSKVIDADARPAEPMPTPEPVTTDAREQPPMPAEARAVPDWLPDEYRQPDGTPAPAFTPQLAALIDATPDELAPLLDEVLEARVVWVCRHRLALPLTPDLDVSGSIVADPTPDGEPVAPDQAELLRMILRNVLKLEGRVGHVEAKLAVVDEATQELLAFTQAWQETVSEAASGPMGAMLAGGLGNVLGGLLPGFTPPDSES